MNKINLNRILTVSILCLTAVNITQSMMKKSRRTRCMNIDKRSCSSNTLFTYIAKGTIEDLATAKMCLDKYNLYDLNSKSENGQNI